jgi:type II secretory pathway predicted ATPase ExeA
MIERHYGLNLAPFRLVPDPRFFYASSTHARALAYLQYGLEQGEGLVVVTGDVGAGKSIVLSQLLQQIDRAYLEVARLATTNLEPMDALRRVARLFGVAADADDKATVQNAIEAYLQELARSGRRALLLIDEAQSLPRETLEELRMLTNFEVDARFPLQCFLVGQPQFRATLLEPAMEQFRQRVIASYHLQPLEVEELRGYAEHRLAVAGWNGRPSLSPELFPQLHRASGGLPRRLNALLGRLLLLGALEGRDHLDPDALSTVLKDLESESLGTPTDAPTPPAGAGSVPDATPRLTALEERVSELETILLDVVEAASQLLEPMRDAKVIPFSTNGSAAGR